ncbi:MAG: sigma-E processing peptidase SpoIIGA [Oscillospiraceae bacterium]|nr:sigma-E processing peptidase SpoIIGA [Oscillospiraceae bacterium]
MKTVYADALIGLNAAVDYLLLLAAGRLCALPLCRWRLLLAALWGGGYALLNALCPGFFGLWTVKLLSGALTAVIAFGAGKQSLRAVAGFFAVSAAFAGTMYAASGLAGSRGIGPADAAASFRTLTLCFALGYGAVRLIFRHRGRAQSGRIRQVSLTLGERSVSFPALEDTGNRLVDPVTGLGVLVASAGAVEGLFAEPAALFDPDPVPALERLNRAGGRFRLLPCATAAADGALLLCFTPGCAAADGVPLRLAVAVTPRSLSPDGSFQALLPPRD